MKSVLLATSLMAVVALSKPLEKRYYVTDTDTETFTVTVTETEWGPDATSVWQEWGSWSADPTTTSTTSATSTTTAWQEWGSWSQSADPAAATSTSTTSSTTPSTTWSSYTTEAPVSTPSPTTTAWTTGSSAPSSSAAASSAAASSGSVSSYAQAILDQHNNHRANHSAQALTWDDNLTNIAQQIAESCVYAHNTQAGGGGYGQNIGAGASPDAVPALITNEMYNDEIGFFPLPYGQAQPDMSNFELWGHFSQIVWQSTTSVGCATVNCPNGLANTGAGVSPWFTVCNYSPPGNFEGEYGANIAAPSGDPVVIVPS